jgi:hypothetical protein
MSEKCHQQTHAPQQSLDRFTALAAQFARHDGYCRLRSIRHAQAMLAQKIK